MDHITNSLIHGSTNCICSPLFWIIYIWKYGWGFLRTVRIRTGEVKWWGIDDITEVSSLTKKSERATRSLRAYVIFPKLFLDFLGPIAAGLDGGNSLQPFSLGSIQRSWRELDIWIKLFTSERSRSAVFYSPTCQVKRELSGKGERTKALWFKVYRNVSRVLLNVKSVMLLKQSQQHIHSLPRFVPTVYSKATAVLLSSPRGIHGERLPLVRDPTATSRGDVILSFWSRCRLTFFGNDLIA